MPVKRLRTELLPFSKWKLVFFSASLLILRCQIQNTQYRIISWVRMHINNYIWYSFSVCVAWKKYKLYTHNNVLCNDKKIALLFWTLSVYSLDYIWLQMWGLIFVLLILLEQWSLQPIFWFWISQYLPVETKSGNRRKRLGTRKAKNYRLLLLFFPKPDLLASHILLNDSIVPKRLTVCVLVDSI